MKKWIAAFLACLMALLPMLSLADSDSLFEELLDELDDGKQELVVTLSATPGEALDNALIKSLMEGVSARLNLREDMLGATLLLSGSEALVAQMRRSGNALYAFCNAIGSDIYYLTSNGNGAATAPLATLEMVDELDLDELKNRSIYEIFADAVDGDKEMLAWYQGVLATATTEKGEFATEHSDPAITKLNVTLTAETLKALLSTKYVKDTLMDKQKGMGKGQTAAEAQELLDKISAALDRSELTANVTCLLAEKDVPVSLAVEMHRKHTLQDGTQTPLIERAQVDKKTTAGATLLTGSASQQEEGKDEPSITAGGTVMFSAKGDTIDFDLVGQVGKLAATAKGTLTTGASGLTATVDATLARDGKTTTITADGLLDVTKTGLNGVVALSVNGTTVGKLNIKGELTAPTAAFDRLLAATPENSIQPLSMNDAEREQMLSNIRSNVFFFALSLLGKLPAGISTEMMGTLLGQ